ncbi:hypothetical protein BVC71_10595 [Marivivens niveibacter]|uniref:Extensin-like C-terminal domain-containing protein n=1 Tax=Marivivens niveibacter TaxID=1930667 RepID=A0A251WYE1_9RHOB|nr:extensin family protein [Marivivens niveibacter]OUD09145.1 hypothetical protein BVC71_10595 [Marivivens niveibacter]
MIRAGALICIALWAGVASAEAPINAPAPPVRPTIAPDTLPRPLARPDGLIPAPSTPETDLAREAMATPASQYAVQTSTPPIARTGRVERRAAEIIAARARGMVCSDPDIQGEYIAPINGAGACGVDQPVRLRSVMGITFNDRPTIDCPTAIALKNWLSRSAIPVIGSEGGGLERLNLMGHYSCRNRNGAASGRLSEHAFGRAIDIGSFRLRDGSEISVLNDWGTRANGRQLREMHRGACGIFGTVLGPEANAAHRNHFHFDTARYRSGSYCR